MRRWTLLLGGLTAWAVHFLGLYALASLEDIERSGPWRTVMLMFSVACLATTAAAGLWSVRWIQRRGSAAVDLFVGQVAAAGAGLSAIAIVWQTLAVLIAP